MDGFFRQHGSIVMIAVAETLVWAAFFYTFPILLLEWEADLGWSRSEVVIGLTLALSVSALSAPAAGRLIDQGHGPRLFPISAFGGGCLLLALSLIESQIAFYAIWALIGLAMAGSFYEPCFAFLTRTRGRKTGRSGARGAITLVTLVAGFASTLCFPVATALTEAYGWRVTLQVFAVVVIVVAVPLFAIAAARLERESTAEAPHADRAAGAQAARRARARPAFLLLAAAFPMVALSHGMTISHLMPVLADRGAAPALAVLAASLIGPAQVGGRMIMALSPPRLTATALAVGCFALMALAFAVIYLADGGAIQIIAFVMIFGAGYGIMSIVRPVLAAELLGQAGFGAISGALALPYVACFAAAPFIASLIWRIGGYDLMLVVSGILALIGLGLVAAASRAAAIDPHRISG